MREQPTPTPRDPRTASTVNVHEAKTHLSRLLERVEAGERITIARNGRPVAELVAPRPRGITLGLGKGKIFYDPDTFDEPDEELTRLMTEGPI
ncbi:type II toxin-antitoxin system Phd/YefM family antitoxin [Phycicoccus sonneratiae]|uniref:Antitoxin n=1 Tax=Phycicoccus sonneratiae TaxID=2807628 RepID=A0ABS2CGJ9_9MICO|nr:type II toxin-antitoxin system prevent-host-death family antitoxin [Phycicoccus sonneraticus]MBM6398940.1 type II toxin-antitoxin system prevent-host-death family antitoxin [Phycicoccus sonneraticus]